MGVVYFVFVDRGGVSMKKAIELMSYEDYKSLLIEGPQADYYLGRWDYYKEVIEIIKRENVKNTVELGPGYMPIVKNGDVILNPLDDPFGKPNESDSKEYVFDATITPWPIADKTYNMFIALQVWEHLDGKQTRAFREVMRIAKKAILSFPYNWDGGIIDRPSHRAHRDIDMELIRDWTLGIEPKLTIEIGRTGPEFSKGPRMICFWDFSN
jgi:hypothetical protein